VSILRGIYRFLYDFIIGDDWKVAAAVLTALVVGLGLLSAGVSTAVTVVSTAILLFATFTTAMIVDVRSGRC
jgi:hypothetical protein